MKEHRFDPEKAPRIPRGARGKGNTLFHTRLQLWREAKAEYEAGGKAGPFALLYEEWSNTMETFYGMLTAAMHAADKAVKKAGLDSTKGDGEALYARVRQEYEREHKVVFPEVG